MKLLKDILYRVRIQEVIGNTHLALEQITADSRVVGNLCLFVAVPGTQTDGHTFITSAINKGAVAIILERFPGKLVEGVTYIKVENAAEALGILACNFYDNPSEKLNLVGITGTNGKTTCVTLLHTLLRGMGKKAGLISTVENKINDKVEPSTHTTPDPIALNKLLAKMVAEGCNYVFMEVSSHAVHQRRIAGIQFSVAGFTNITHDHLDYHGTFDNYIKAKKLFFDALPGTATAITNADDRNGAVMLQNTKAKKRTYGVLNIADYKSKMIENLFTGLLLNLDGHEFYSKLIGKFNAYNLTLVYAVANVLGFKPLDVLVTLSDLNPARGRFQYHQFSDKIVGIVDYAHTPDALDNVLQTIKEIRTGNEQVITLVGCGGNRDKTKRPEMARIACNLSDRVILTSDNPRDEDPMQILAEMQQGVEPQHFKKTISIPDRREAIKQACIEAKPGDIILIAGKGHETYQEIKGVKHPFDDAAILLETMKILKK
ncbi:MAG: UDP-N-acetylmuramoyl-L-alanyl-D-glutamate--2,6-diaminopimelate ligase [Luteibaculaceae bacterium]